MTTPGTGQFTTTASQDQRPAEAANHQWREAELARDAADLMAPPGQSHHDLAVGLPAGPDDASKHAGGDDSGYAS